MLEAVRDGVIIFVRNMPLLGALVLTIWVPGNIALNYAAPQTEGEISPLADFWYPVIIDGVFGPLALGGRGLCTSRAVAE